MENYLIHYTVDEFHQDLKRIVSETIRENKPDSKEPASPEYLTRHEVAERLHVSFPTLNRFAKDGILTPRKIGGRVLYLWSEVEKAIKQGQNLKYRRV